MGRNDDSSGFLKSDVKKNIAIIFLVIFGLISILSLFNAAGIVGQWINSILVVTFGWTRYIIPLLFLYIIYLLFADKELRFTILHITGMFFLLLALNGIAHMFVGLDNMDVITTGNGGGYLGYYIYYGLYTFVGKWVSFIVLFSTIFISLMFIFDSSLNHLFVLLKVENLKPKVQGKMKLKKRMILVDEDDDEEYEDYEDVEEDEDAEDEEGYDDVFEEDDDEEYEDEDIDIDELEEDDDEDEEFVIETEDDIEKTLQDTDKGFDYTIIPKVKMKADRIDIPFDLLQNSKDKPTSGDIDFGRRKIEKTLEHFGIQCEMADVKVGPTVTQYTLKPAEGVKLSKISTLNDNLAYALAAHPIRIEAPIPGKSLVGIEVPNKQVAMVMLRDILESKEFKQRKNNLTVAIGKDVSGKAWLEDLAKMPHLLVAGSTGSGKSVCLNTMLVSLLYQNTPDTLRFIMIDPKRVELMMYNGIPHLLTPVIADVTKTVNALKWAISEMERRYDLLAGVGKRNIESYNQKAEEPLPYIVIIIDELADLMITAANEIESSIIRLTQMARAVGIHMIIATQRPSVDVITGLIKANVPARFAFSVASATDSRTILDTMGAEKLIGKGDMLMLTKDISKPRRLQGAYISDVEIKNVVRHLKDSLELPVEYNDEIVSKGGNGSQSNFNISDDDDYGDELYEEARDVVLKAKKASASLLQRRLRVGYARAARLIDILEEEGVVGPSQGSKPREILIVSEEDYDEDDE